MAATLSLMVLGQAYLLGPLPNASWDGLDITMKFEPMTNRREDYTYTPGVGAHKIHSTATTWYEARKTCKEEGGHLAVINSVAESQAIAKLFPKSLPHEGSRWPRSALIGFHDLYGEGDHVSVHGNSLEKEGFAEWYTGEPSDTDSTENCGSVLDNGKLNDSPCDAVLAFVRELSDEDAGVRVLQATDPAPCIAAV